MPSLNMSALPSLRKQQLLSEFAGLKQACPEGMFVSLTPGDATLWSGVLFVRKGPYCPAILRFQISFPDSYPQLPPLVVFTTDMFHPLITPLTTYMYTTDIQESGTVSASDQERLPPGGFSLRHGFPDWFGRGRRSMAEARHTDQQRLTSPDAGASNSTTPAVQETPAYMRTGHKSVSAYEVLHYIRSAFDDEAVLDSVPLAAAGNPGAWHAWRTHRKATGKLVEDETTEEGQTSKEDEQQATENTKSATPRRPGEWNWDGVWEDRVKKNVSSSLSEPVLYGETKMSDDLIKFLAMEHTDIDSVKDNLRRTLGQI
ncbi:uncharacterized protein FIESC28_11059 [Fusarium coffeatum]|uniref:UBC core domain-containing protein n=1 Tax=Fusarium coffeatum TaxID=231269 RepID=A0A366QQM2_9HYPO|nr:uncharacterized protein FIESC28_11059 [Fusarium coffeatum]RBR06436.1 hypothetical protein FIESC28_11059 [Fusarium coffeatum]